MTSFLLRGGDGDDGDDDGSGWVPLKVICNFPKVKKISKDIRAIAAALEGSEVLVVSKATRVRRKVRVALGTWLALCCLASAGKRVFVKCSGQPLHDVTLRGALSCGHFRSSLRARAARCARFFLCGKVNPSFASMLLNRKQIGLHCCLDGSRVPCTRAQHVEVPMG